MLKKQSVYPKKIVWISNLRFDIDLYKSGKIETLRSLAKRGHEIVLFSSFSSNKEWLNEITDIHIISIPLRYVPFFSTIAYVLILLLYLPFFFLYWKPDFILVDSNASALSLITSLIFPKIKKLNIVLNIRSTPVYIVGISGRLNNFIFKISVFIAKKFFQGITIITELMKEEVCNKYNINPDFVGVFTAGVSTEIFRSEKYSGNEIRKKYSLEDKFIIFCHGTFFNNRGIIETVQAIRILKDLYSNIFLFLLGDANFPLKNLIVELGVQKRVKFHESVSYSEVPKYIAMCDVGIVPLPNLPDWRYQCPLNLLEYLSMQKVVIATDIPANRVIIGNSKSGIYIPSSDPKDIADAIIYLYKNKKMLKKWGMLGRKIVEDKYDWNIVAKKLENYLLNL